MISNSFPKFLAWRQLPVLTPLLLTSLPKRHSCTKRAWALRWGVLCVSQVCRPAGAVACPFWCAPPTSCFLTRLKGPFTMPLRRPKLGEEESAHRGWWCARDGGEFEAAAVV